MTSVDDSVPDPSNTPDSPQGSPIVTRSMAAEDEINRKRQCTRVPGSANNEKVFVYHSRAQSVMTATFGDETLQLGVDMYRLICTSHVQRQFQWTNAHVLYMLGMMRDITSGKIEVDFGNIKLRTSEVKCPFPFRKSYLPKDLMSAIPESSKIFAYTIVDGMHRVTVLWITVQACLNILGMARRDNVFWQKEYLEKERDRYVATIHDQHYSKFNLRNILQADYTKNLSIDFKPGEDSPFTKTVMQGRADASLRYGECQYMFKSVTDFLRSGEGPAPTCGFPKIVDVATTIHEWIVKEFNLKIRADKNGVQTVIEPPPPTTPGKKVDSPVKKLRVFYEALLVRVYVTVNITLNQSPENAAKSFISGNLPRTPPMAVDYIQAHLIGERPYIKEDQSHSDERHTISRSDELSRIQQALSVPFKPRNPKSNLVKQIACYYGALYSIVCYYFGCFNIYVNTFNRVQEITSLASKDTKKPYQTPDAFIGRMVTMSHCLESFLGCKVVATLESNRKLKRQELRRVELYLTVIRLVMINPVIEVLGAIVLCLQELFCTHSLTPENGLKYLRLILKEYMDFVLQAGQRKNTTLANDRHRIFAAIFDNIKQGKKCPIKIKASPNPTNATTETPDGKVDVNKFLDEYMEKKERDKGVAMYAAVAYTDACQWLDTDGGLDNLQARVVEFGRFPHGSKAEDPFKILSGLPGVSTDRLSNFTVIGLPPQLHPEASREFYASQLDDISQSIDQLANKCCGEAQLKDNPRKKDKGKAAEKRPRNTSPEINGHGAAGEGTSNPKKKRVFVIKAPCKKVVQPSSVRAASPDSFPNN